MADVIQIGPDEALSDAGQSSLVDVVDTLLDCGVVLRGELWLGVADVDLVFLGLDLVLANPDTMRRLGGPTANDSPLQAET